MPVNSLPYGTVKRFEMSYQTADGRACFLEGFIRGFSEEGIEPAVNWYAFEVRYKSSRSPLRLNFNFERSFRDGAFTLPEAERLFVDWCASLKLTPREVSAN